MLFEQEIEIIYQEVSKITKEVKISDVTKRDFDHRNKSISDAEYNGHMENK